MSDEKTDRLDNAELVARLDRLERTQKEREVSFFRALKTLGEDLAQFRTGEREEFPREAVLGLVFAYLRPRVLIVIGSLAAVSIGVMQLWLLVNQNRLLDQQNTFIQSQTESDRVQAVSSIVGAIDLGNSSSVAAGVAQLGAYGEQATEPLLAMLGLRSDYWAVAAEALAGTIPDMDDDVAVRYVGGIIDNLRFEMHVMAEKSQEARSLGTEIGLLASQPFFATTAANIRTAANALNSLQQTRVEAGRPPLQLASIVEETWVSDIEEISTKTYEIFVSVLVDSADDDPSFWSIQLSQTANDLPPGLNSVLYALINLDRVLSGWCFFDSATLANAKLMRLPRVSCSQVSAFRL